MKVYTMKASLFTLTSLMCFSVLASSLGEKSLLEVIDQGLVANTSGGDRIASATLKITKFSDEHSVYPNIQLKLKGSDLTFEALAAAHCGIQEFSTSTIECLSNENEGGDNDFEIFKGNNETVQVTFKKSYLDAENNPILARVAAINISKDDLEKQNCPAGTKFYQKRLFPHALGELDELSTESLTALAAEAGMTAEDYRAREERREYGACIVELGSQHDTNLSFIIEKK